YWFPGPDLAVARNSPAAVALPNGNVLVVGGSLLNGQCEIFDPVTNLISPGPMLPRADNIVSAILVSSDKVLVAQRENNPLTGVLSLVDVNTMQLEPIRIEAMGTQVCLIDSETVALGYNRSTAMQPVKWRNSLQPTAKWQYIWKVSRMEIDQFKADFLANAVDFDRYPHIETWPAHGSVSDGEDRNLAPFVDVNLDGLYRPADDGDYPCIVGDQALWWVFNDQGEHLESRGLPMGLQIEAMAYAFDCNQTTCPDTSLDYATFLHYEITNHSDTAWSNMYIGVHYDIDLGGFFDDFVGCDSTLSLAFGYNGDNSDANYGTAPPAWGAAILPNGQLPQMDGFMTFESSFGNYNSNPTSPAHHYNYLRSEWLDSTHLVNNGSNGHLGSASGPPTNFMYPSTQGFCGGFLSGWSELTAGTTPFDRKFLQSSGPFSLQPGQSIQYDIVYPFARDSSYTQSVCALKDATAAMQAWWQNQLDRSCFSIVVGEESREPEAAFKVIPNPVTGNEFMADFGHPLLSGATLDLIDLNGRVVERKVLGIGTERQLVNVAHLPAGVYLARLHQADGMRVQRVVVW
ncbi:MAG TPA: T9SS type A sorting domain-containing protein, partial [Bacteroidia bacterium]|nr:T9SS type A sorting domain-containing protein [Bacteroidia bacterium]